MNNFLPFLGITCCSMKPAAAACPLYCISQSKVTLACLLILNLVSWAANAFSRVQYWSSPANVLPMYCESYSQKRQPPKESVTSCSPT